MWNRERTIFGIITSILLLLSILFVADVAEPLRSHVEFTQAHRQMVDMGLSIVFALLGIAIALVYIAFFKDKAE